MVLLTDEHGSRTPHFPSTPYVHPDGSVSVTCQCGRVILADTIEKVANIWYDHLPEDEEDE